MANPEDWKWLEEIEKTATVITVYSDVLTAKLRSAWEREEKLEKALQNIATNADTNGIRGPSPQEIAQAALASGEKTGR